MQLQVLHSCNYMNKHMSSLLNQTYIAYCHVLLGKLRSNATFCGPTMTSRMIQHLFSSAATCTAQNFERGEDL